MSTCDSEHVPCEVHFHILRFVLCWGVFVMLGRWSHEILPPITRLVDFMIAFKSIQNARKDMFKESESSSPTMWLQSRALMRRPRTPVERCCTLPLKLDSASCTLSCRSSLKSSGNVSRGAPQTLCRASCSQHTQTRHGQVRQTWRLKPLWTECWLSSEKLGISGCSEA
jgi:hypothetical protein